MWLLEKYEWLFFLLYRKFKNVYPINDDIVRYPVLVLNIPTLLVYGYIVNFHFEETSRALAIVIGLVFVLPQFYYFSDERIEELEKKYND